MRSHAYSHPQQRNRSAVKRQLILKDDSNGCYEMTKQKMSPSTPIPFYGDLQLCATTHPWRGDKSCHSKTVFLAWVDSRNMLAIYTVGNELYKNTFDYEQNEVATKQNSHTLKNTNIQQHCNESINLWILIKQVLSKLLKFQQLLTYLLMSLYGLKGESSVTILYKFRIIILIPNLLSPYYSIYR